MLLSTGRDAGGEEVGWVSARPAPTGPLPVLWGQLVSGHRGAGGRLEVQAGRKLPGNVLVVM